MSKILFLALLFVSTIAHAGFRRGNGGHVLICEQNQSKNYQLLDMFEAKTRYQFSVEFATGGDEYQRAQKIIDRFDRQNPNRKKLYSAWLKSFASESQFIDGLNIVGVPDVGV